MIMWHGDKLLNVCMNYLINLTEDQLQTLPLENLEMSSAQLFVLHSAHETNTGRTYVGEQEKMLERIGDQSKRFLCC
jgi:hypothetical protein